MPVVSPPEARVAVPGYVVLGDAEDLADLDAGPDLRAGPIMRLLQDAEQSLGGGLRPLVDEGAAAVAAVAPDGGAAVDLDEVALLQASVALRVNPDPHPGTDGRKDPVVRMALVAGIAHRRLRDAHDVAVAHLRGGHAGPSVLDREAYPCLRELRSPPQPLDLEGVLDAPELVHVVGEVHPLGIRGQGRKAAVRVEEHVAQIRPDPRPEQPAVPKQPAHDPVLLALVELRGPGSVGFPTFEWFLQHLCVADLDPQPERAHVPDARHPLGRLGLEVA